MKRLASWILTALVLCPAAALARQEGSITGAVMDDTKGVLPGATVTAASLETGRSFTAVTNERGEFRIPGVPAGRYKVQAELSGFSTVIVPNLELLVGQNRTVPFTMQVATLQESRHRRRGDTARGHHGPRRCRAMSIAARWKSCRSRAAIGWSCR